MAYTFIFRRKAFQLLSALVVSVLFIKYYDFGGEEPQTLQKKASQSPCDDPKLNEWASVEFRLFFKKNAAYYFTDSQLLQTYYLDKKPSNKSAFNLHFQAYSSSLKKTIEFNLSDVKPWSILEREWYAMRGIDARFDMKSILSAHDMDINQVSVSLFVEEVTSGLRTEYPLTIKFKNMLNKESLAKKSNPDQSKRFTSAICQKCVTLWPVEHKRVRWWLEVNKRAGYEQVFMCNNSMHDDPLLNSIFSDYKDFITLKQLKCVPNLYRDQPEEPDYIRVLSEIHFNGHFEPYVEVINDVNLRECYFDNFDKYDYISVLDFNELVVPTVSERGASHLDYREFVSKKETDPAKKFPFLDNDKCNRLKDANYLTAYLKEQTFPQYKYHSIKFNPVIMIDSKIFEEMIQKVGEYLFSLDIQSIWKTNNFTHKIPMEKVKVDIRIDSQEEFIYATKLVELYRTKLAPIIKNSTVLFELTGGTFNRFFFLARNMTRHGKTIHNTASTSSLDQYGVLDTFFKDTQNGQFATELSPELQKYVRELSSVQTAASMPYEKVYESYFPGHFSPQAELIEFNMFEFYFDVNYFNCYVLPIAREVFHRNITL